MVTQIAFCAIHITFQSGIPHIFASELQPVMPYGGSEQTPNTLMVGMFFDDFEHR